MNLRMLLWKDLRVEWRGKEGLASGLVLVALFFILYLFTRQDLASAPVEATVALWVPLLYVTTIMSARSFAAEIEEGTLDRLRTLPVDLGLHGVSKTIVNAILGATVGVVTVLLLHLGWGIPLSLQLWLVVGLALWGLVVVGTLTGALAAHARAREVLVPILAIPVLAPLLQAGAVASLAAIRGDPDPTAVLILLGYDIIATGVAMLLWPSAMEAT